MSLACLSCWLGLSVKCLFPSVSAWLSNSFLLSLALPALLSLVCVPELGSRLFSSGWSWLLRTQGLAALSRMSQELWEGMRAQIPPLVDLREGTQGRVAGWATDCDKRFFQIMFMGWVETFQQASGKRNEQSGRWPVWYSAVLLLWGGPSACFPLGGLSRCCLCAGPAVAAQRVHKLLPDGFYLMPDLSNLLFRGAFLDSQCLRWVTPG